VEVINLRCFNDDIDPVIKQYIAPVLLQEEVCQIYDIIVYKHYKMDMELVISINYKQREKDSQNQKSSLGYQLTRSLKPFGIINHSIWEELDV
jgi:hypothetical protein